MIFNIFSCDGQKIHFSRALNACDIIFDERPNDAFYELLSNFAWTLEQPRKQIICNQAKSITVITNEHRYIENV